MDASSILNKKDNIENEHQEKLNNKDNNEISIPNAQIYNIEDAKIVCTDYDIDDHTIVKREPMVFIKIPNNKKVQSNFDILTPVGGANTTTSISCDVIPCAALSRYIKMHKVVGSETHTLEKKIGFTNRFTESSQVTGSVTAGIKDCEAKIEVTLKYENESSFTSEKTESWQETLSEGIYVVYQNVLIYAFIFILDDKLYKNACIKCPNLIKLEDGPGENKTYLLLAPINRNDPFTVHQEEIVFKPVEYDDLVEYLIKNKENWLD